MHRFCCFWAINGILQGFGGPCCARILTAWFATGERGTYWGMWNIAHNLGGFMAPIICGKSLQNTTIPCQISEQMNASRFVFAWCASLTTQQSLMPAHQSVVVVCLRFVRSVLVCRVNCQRLRAGYPRAGHCNTQ